MARLKTDLFMSCPECGSLDSDLECPGTVRRKESCLWKPKFCFFCGDPLDGGEGTWYSAITNLETCKVSSTKFHEAAF